MKVLLYSHCFYPSVGGLETVSLTLAQGFYSNSINIKVVTATPSNEASLFPFEVIRQPQRKQQIALVKWADVILFNGASLALQPWILFLKKPFVWIHTGYQVSCIDGIGWVSGKQAPLKPFASFIYHKQLQGWIPAMKEAAKLLVRRAFAKYLVSKNVAITNWMFGFQPLRRQVQIYNPFPLDQFCNFHQSEKEYDFLYVGRIVSEKGIPTLLKAFSKVCLQIQRPLKLLIIGDGDYRQSMEKLSEDLNISKSINFTGAKTGNELLELIAKAKIAVVPSEWYEPMGVVALELMASGKNLIVSERGGLKECVGDAGLCFPNGNDEALAICMIKLLEDESLRNQQLANAQEKIKKFEPSLVIKQYINLLENVSGLN